MTICKEKMTMKRIPVILLTALLLLSGVFLPAVPAVNLISAAYAEDASTTLEELLAQRAEIDNAIALAKEEEIIEGAIDALAFRWEQEYLKYPPHDQEDYLEIKWARVVYIKDGVSEKGAEQFTDMLCYVEFFLLSNYFGAAPYYPHAGVLECVAFRRDGTFDVLKQDPINQYRAKTFQMDFSHIIQSISDRGSEFNQVILPRNNQAAE